jgi:hypothetical protein
MTEPINYHIATPVCPLSKKTCLELNSIYNWKFSMFGKTGADRFMKVNNEEAIAKGEGPADYAIKALTRNYGPEQVYEKLKRYSFSSVCNNCESYKEFKVSKETKEPWGDDNDGWGDEEL